LKLRIEKAIYGGAGLAREQGRAVFVPFTLGGEVVEAHMVVEKNGYATAEVDTILEPSPARREAPCPYFGRCGGCHYQHAEYGAQVEMKLSILRETLERAHIGGIPDIAPVTAEPFGYRNRVRLHIQREPFALCYKYRKSHANLAISGCPITAPSLQSAIETLGREGEALGIGGWADEMELFTDAEQSKMLAAFWTKNDAKEAKRRLTECWPKLCSAVPGLVGAGVFSSAQGRRVSRLVAGTGEDSLLYRCGAQSWRVSLGSFFQVNRFLIERLVQLVTVGERGRVAWDLYAGVGLFSKPLTAHFDEVVAVESAQSAVADLRFNLKGSRHRVIAAETAGFLRDAVAAPAPDLVIVDPPRSGLGREVTSILGKLQPRNITYVSCDPATLSRDLAALLESGYRLGKMHLVDLFPQTFHLESVTHLSLG